MSVLVATSDETALEPNPRAQPGDFAWRILRLTNTYRLVIAVTLLLAFMLVRDPHIVGETDPGLAWVALLALLGIGVVEIPLLRSGWPSRTVQTYFQFTLDAVAVILLMHASGGVSSGFGGLLVVSVGCLALLVPPDRAFLLAAVTTLALLVEQTLAQWQGLTTSAQFVPTGILGAVIFVITGVVQFLRMRIVETEALAEQRGTDLRNLVELNDYIIQHLRESIVVVDTADRVRLINESAGKLLAVPGPVVGAPLEELSPRLAERLRLWREGELDLAGTTVVLDGDDATANIQPHFARLGGGGGDGIVMFLEDTSLIAERVQQMKLAALGRLSASIAHEIRNPLGALSHAAQLLAESEHMGPDDQRLTDIIRVNSARVSNIVASVLALSKSDKIRPEPIDLKRWARDFAEEFTSTQELFEDAVSLREDSAEFEVQMDRTHLHQVLWNLCDNAVKYASQTAGAIAVEISCGYVETSGRPYLEVADRGPGVDPELIEQIFEPFYTGQRGGTGLGLYISRELCERNGATLRYHARPGGGSIFRVVFADPNRWKE